MKKTKFLALVLVVAIMMMGAGYAAWTDTLKINTTVKTGTLDVDFVDIELMHLSPEVDVEVGIFPLDGNSDNDGDNDKVVMDISNLYPGAEVRHQFTIKNKSSITVDLDSIELVGTGDPILYMEMEIMQIKDNQAYYIPFGKFTENKSLKPNEEMVLDIAFRLNHDAPNETTEDKTIQYEITLEYTQNYPK